MKAFLLLGVLAASAGAAQATPPQLGAPKAPYRFSTTIGTLTMRDGLKLGVTYFLPEPRQKGERFPSLLEMLPYRKDDSFYTRDYPLYAYFARRGFACVGVDVRGTGSSEGAVPEREYSEAELDDGVQVIEQLAKMPWSNGNVGMWGISWSGFNALQVAMRRPPALKAVLAVHASDNVFADSVDFIDGAFHVDVYHLEIHHENGLPKPPDYLLDEAYFKQRFEAYPWFFTYLRHQTDGPFWRQNALRYDYGKLRVPVYAIGGLLDGYRDWVLRLLESASVPVKAEIGPWDHAWPNDGAPGPNYEWGVEATAWWDHWLRGKNNGIGAGKSLQLFVREGHPPDEHLRKTPGRWRTESWPVQRTVWKRLFPSEHHELGARPEKDGILRLRYLPGYGSAAGLWWGEPTGDMRPDDAGSLVFEGPELAESVEIIGFPKARLRVSMGSPVTHWIARLEDVQPDGTVALVTGAVSSAGSRPDPLRPEPAPAAQAVDVAFDLHFTTWTFRAGHHIRLAVSNAQFPMIWPTPNPMTNVLHLGEATFLEIPSIPAETRPTPNFAPPEPRESRTDAQEFDCQEWPDGARTERHDVSRGLTQDEWHGDCGWQIQGRRYHTAESVLYEVADNQPSEARFRGDESTRIELRGRTVELRSVLEVRSDLRNFYVTFIRRILENEDLVREKQWSETIPRQFQ